MTKSVAKLAVIIGAIGFLSLMTLGGITFMQGRIGDAPVQSLTTCGPTHPTGTVVHVTLSDQGNTMMGASNVMMASLYATPGQAHAGYVTFVASNIGALMHELLILPAPRNAVWSRVIGTDGKINESTSLGEASTSCGAGPGSGISPATTSWVTLHLAAGNYELLCDEPWHYANGMFQSFQVQ